MCQSVGVSVYKVCRSIDVSLSSAMCVISEVAITTDVAVVRRVYKVCRSTDVSLSSAVCVSR